MPTLELPALVLTSVTAVTTKARLLLVNRDPGPGEEGVPRDSQLRLELVDLTEVGVDPTSILLWIDGVLAVEGKTLSPGFTGSVLASGGSLRVSLARSTPFESSSEVRVRVRARTSDGAASLDESYAFAIEDHTAPKLVAAIAVGPKTVRLAFDEPISVPEGARFAFSPRERPAVPLDVVGVRAIATLLDLDLSHPMSPDVPYEVSVTGVEDLHGSPVGAPFDHATFRGFRPPRPPGRRFDLWSMLPRHNRREDETGDLRKFVACLQEVLDLELAHIDAFTDLFDLERAPEPWLDLILSDLGNPFSFDLTTSGKRRLAAALVDMYRLKGTAPGIRRALQHFLALEVLEISGLAATALVLGESELGVDWELGPSSRFARYAFSLEVHRVLSPAERRQVRAVVDLLKPAHTHFVDLIEPLPPPTFDHWELGVSEVGDSAILH